MNEAERELYGDEFVDGVAAIRYIRSFDTEHDAKLDLVETLFLKTFNAVERWAADNDVLAAHEQAWRLHDEFCGAMCLSDALPIYGRLHRLLVSVSEREAT